MKRLFISRALDPESRFHELEQMGIQIQDQSLLEIKAVEFSLEKNYDWVFFYSKNGIRYFFDRYAYNPRTRFGVMGSASASYFKELNGSQADLIGGSSAEQIADQLNDMCGDKELLFAKAKQSLSSIEKILEEKHGKLSDHIHVYDNSVKEDFDIDSCDILVFTSPMNVRAYFNKYDYKQEVLFSIGERTASMVKTLTGKDSLFPIQSNEEALFKLIHAYLKDN